MARDEQDRTEQETEYVFNVFSDGEPDADIIGQDTGLSLKEARALFAECAEPCEIERWVNTYRVCDSNLVDRKFFTIESKGRNNENQSE